jgi:hypothetical protein
VPLSPRPESVLVAAVHPFLAYFAPLLSGAIDRSQ